MCHLLIGYRSVLHFIKLNQILRADFKQCFRIKRKPNILERRGMRLLFDICEDLIYLSNRFT